MKEIQRTKWKQELVSTTIKKVGIVYIIHNNINGNKYVGKSVQPLFIRFRQHCIAFEKGSKSYIHKAISKYGKSNFVCRVLEKTENIQILGDLEKKWILIKKTHISQGGYNLTWGGDGGATRTGMKISEETKEKMRVANKGVLHGPKLIPFSKERNMKISIAQKGKPKKKGWHRSEKDRKAISLRMKGNQHGNGSTQTEEHKKKLSILMKERKPWLLSVHPPVSEETKEKIRNSLLGRKLSEETKQKISEGVKRNNAK